MALRLFRVGAGGRIVSTVSTEGAGGGALVDAEARGPVAVGSSGGGASAWLTLVGLTLLAAVLRLSTLDLQSLWYDEAFTPVHVFHASLTATWHSYVHSENTPPLWYALEWPIVRLFGTGAVALRMLSALAGVATVPVAWAIGFELQNRPTRDAERGQPDSRSASVPEQPPSASAAERPSARGGARAAGVPSPTHRAAIATAAFVATSPLLVWYSQEARAYALFVLLAALSFLCFLRALSDSSPRRLWQFAVAAGAALLSHYFAVFLLAPMIVLLARRGRRALVPLALPVMVGAALIPLIVAQGGHGTQWIGEWALVSRLEAVPQYYLTGYTGSALGHGIELLVALPILAGVLYGLWRALSPAEERGALLALVVTAGGTLLPLALALLGADYLAPRNLVAAMVPLSALLAVVIVARRTAGVGIALAGVVAAGYLTLTVDVDLSPRLQRGDWRGVAAVLLTDRSSRRVPRRGYRSSIDGSPARAIVTPELGAAPLEHYLAPLSNLGPGRSARVSEVVETGYVPLRRSAGTPPAAGLRLVARRDIHGLYVYRFTSPRPITISERTLRESAITEAPRPEVLVPGASG